MSYTVRGMCGDSAKVEEEFTSLEEARVLFEQLKTSDRYLHSFTVLFGHGSFAT